MPRVSVLVCAVLVSLALPASAGAHLLDAISPHGPGEQGSSGAGSALLPVAAMLTFVALAGLVVVVRRAGTKR